MLFIEDLAQFTVPFQKFGRNCHFDKSIYVTMSSKPVYFFLLLHLNVTHFFLKIYKWNRTRRQKWFSLVRVSFFALKTNAFDAETEFWLLISSWKSFPSIDFILSQFFVFFFLSWIQVCEQYCTEWPNSKECKKCCIRLTDYPSCWQA